MLYITLHGFREGRGAGTATLEVKLVQNLSGLAHDPLFRVFLDIRTAYESLNRDQCLEILRG